MLFDRIIMNFLGILALICISTYRMVNADELWDSISGVQKLMTGYEDYDEKFYVELVDCLNQLDPKLFLSTNAQWRGFKEYGQSGGNPGIDDWKPCPTQRWFENNCTYQEYGNISIWEPCNYASNIAYYRTVVEICRKKSWSLPMESVDSFGKTFASLGLGSAFMHGSQTSVGSSSDTVVNDLFTYVVFEETLKPLRRIRNSSILLQLSEVPRPHSAIESVDNFMNMYIEVPVEKWGDLLEAEQVPNLRLGMCGFFATALTLVLEEEQVDILANFLVNAFHNIDDDMEEICLEKFLPELREVTKSIRPLPQEEAQRLAGNTLGTVIKFLYAFLWQEQELVSSDILLLPMVNQIGARLLPLVNRIATALTNFDYSSVSFQSGRGFFPGQDWCNDFDPHAKWHLETSIALADFSFLADDMHKILSTIK